VDGMLRNQWTTCSGFGGRLAPDSLVAIDRITHLNDVVSQWGFNGTSGYGYYMYEEAGNYAFEKIILAYDDIRMIEEYVKRFVSKDYFLDFFVKNERTDILHERPELFFTKENIDQIIESANSSKNAEILEFLLDYKNNHFPRS
jgi:hypothetical protein